MTVAMGTVGGGRQRVGDTTPAVVGVRRAVGDLPGGDDGEVVAGISVDERGQ